MKLGEKLEYLLARKRLNKADFAKNVGVTNRALYYYISGERLPRKKVLKRMAEELGVEEEFLANDKIELELTSDERFIKTLLESGKTNAGAVKFLEESKGLFAGNSISNEDKEFLINCLNEIYLDSRKKSDLVK